MLNPFKMPYTSCSDK